MLTLNTIMRKAPVRKEVVSEEATVVPGLKYQPTAAAKALAAGKFYSVNRYNNTTGQRVGSDLVAKLNDDYVSLHSDVNQMAKPGAGPATPGISKGLKAYLESVGSFSSADYVYTRRYVYLPSIVADGESVPWNLAGPAEDVAYVYAAAMGIDINSAFEVINQNGLSFNNIGNAEAAAWYKQQIGVDSEDLSAFAQDIAAYYGAYAVDAKARKIQETKSSINYDLEDIVKLHYQLKKKDESGQTVNGVKLSPTNRIGHKKRLIERLNNARANSNYLKIHNYASNNTIQSQSKSKLSKDTQFLIIGDLLVKNRVDLEAFLEALRREVTPQEWTQAQTDELLNDFDSQHRSKSMPKVAGGPAAKRGALVTSPAQAKVSRPAPVVQQIQKPGVVPRPAVRPAVTAKPPSPAKPARQTVAVPSMGSPPSTPKSRPASPAKQPSAGSLPRVASSSKPSAFGGSAARSASGRASAEVEY